MARARNGKATLLIARLDRLARSVAVTTRLLESGVEFVACDAPFANRLTIQMLAVMAEEESRMISERTKVAIAAAKAQGRVRRHVCNLKAEHQREGVRLSAEMRKARTREAYAEVEPMVVALRQTGLSLKGIAKRLNVSDNRTQRGTPWTDVSVMRLLRRASDAQPIYLLRRSNA